MTGLIPAEISCNLKILRPRPGSWMTTATP
jgi:hypothetical protein